MSEPPPNGNIEQLRRRLRAAMLSRGMSPDAAASCSDIALDVLQQEAGGMNLGRNGFYIPVPKHRPKRDERIRRLAGPGPWSRMRVHLIARDVQCSESTVWRVLARERTA